MNPNDMQVGGNHYMKQGPIQHWDVMIKLGADYLTGCATKYVSRLESKDTPATNLSKARHFLIKRAASKTRPGALYWVRLYLHHRYVLQWLESASMQPAQKACILAILNYDQREAENCLTTMEHIYSDDYRGADHD